MATVPDSELFLQKLREQTDPYSKVNKFGLDAMAADKLSQTGKDIQTIARGVRGQEPVEAGMTEAQRERLIMEYTGYLVQFQKYQTQLQAEGHKDYRSRQTGMWQLELGLLKAGTSMEGFEADTIRAAMPAITEALGAIASEEVKHGRVRPEDMYADHNPQFKSLYTMQHDGVVDPSFVAEFMNGDAGVMKTLQKLERREILPWLIALKNATQVDLTDLAQIPKAFAVPIDMSDHRQLVTLLAEGVQGDREAEAVSTKNTTERKSFLADLKQRHPGSAALWDLMDGIWEHKDELTSPDMQEILGGGGGVSGMGAPDGASSTMTKTGTSDSPYMDETRKHILSEIDKLEAGSTPYHIRVKKSMMQQPGFQKFVDDRGGFNGDMEAAFHAWANEIRTSQSPKHGGTGQKGYDASIMQGTTHAGPLRTLQARFGSAIRDLFGPLGTQAAPGTTPTTATGTTPTTTPTSMAARSAAGAGGGAAAGQYGGADLSSAAITSGASTPTADGAVETSSEKERPAPTVISGDPTAATWWRVLEDIDPKTGKPSGYEFRQYSDGRIDIVATPKDRTVSASNPKPITDDKKRKATEASIEAEYGKYEDDEPIVDTSEAPIGEPEDAPGETKGPGTISKQKPKGAAWSRTQARKEAAQAAMMEKSVSDDVLPDKATGAAAERVKADVAGAQEKKRDELGDAARSAFRSVEDKGPPSRVTSFEGPPPTFDVESSAGQAIVPVEPAKTTENRRWVRNKKLYDELVGMGAE